MENSPYDPPQVPLADKPQAQDISRSELVAFTGDKKYPDRWLERQENKTRFAGFNAWAFLFGVQWFFYRKLYFSGALSVILEAGVPVLVASVAVSFLGRGQMAAIMALVSAVTVRIVIGYWANLALYYQAVRTIRRVDSLNLDNDAHLRLIAREGGVSVMSLLAVYAVLGMLRYAFTSIWQT
jgi:hypothetical protein